jgi:protein-S-isoprenylcysteine O-methyltransferase Ste14
MLAMQVVGACWIAFAIYWAIAARSRKPSAERQDFAGRTVHLGLLALGAVFLIGIRKPYPLDVRIVPLGAVPEIVGGILCVGGLAVAIWARRTLADNWSASVSFRKGHELVVGGPYGYVRHPIYAGLLLMLLGTTLALGRLHAVIGLAACAVSFWIKIRQEEALMMRHFPRSYIEYRHCTKALVPFIW